MESVVSIRTRRLVFRVAVGALAAIGLSGLVAGSASAACSTSLVWVAGAEPRCEQIRYAKETMLLSSSAFLTRKADFLSKGCVNGTAGCLKPAPYNAFDWTTDGCSWTPPTQAANFNRACQQHDFGFRNFGYGLVLERTEARRAWINDRFLEEMRKICEPMGYWQEQVCRGEAQTMYGVVSAASRW